jgi:hypothetical protein
MKGVVFTEFLDMVEQAHGMEMVDAIIDDARPASGGAYTAVGTYDHHELIAMVHALSARTGAPTPVLIRQYGRHLFARFVKSFPQFFRNVHDAFDFLSRVDDHIHVEVRKLHPDAELPRFTVAGRSDEEMELLYRSSRPFADLAHGLIDGCLEHFRTRAEVRREDRVAGAEGGVRFSIRKLAA